MSTDSWTGKVREALELSRTMSVMTAGEVRVQRGATVYQWMIIKLNKCQA